MKIQCPKCKSKYSAKLDSIPEKGRKLECSACSHVFLVRKKSGNIDKTLAVLKDKFNSWDSKMVSLEEDKFTQNILNGKTGHSFTETNSEDLNRLLEEAEIEEKALEGPGGDFTLPGTENGTLKNLADEISGRKAETADEAAEELFDNLFEEVESRDLIVEGPNGIDDEQTGLEGEHDFGEFDAPESAEELDNLFDVLMKEGGEATSNKPKAATEAKATTEDMDTGLDDLFDDIVGTPETEKETGAVTSEERAGVAEEKAGDAKPIPAEALLMASTTLEDLDSAFDEMFGEDAGAMVSKPSTQAESTSSGMEGFEDLAGLVQDLSTEEDFLLESAPTNIISRDEIPSEKPSESMPGDSGDLVDQLMNEANEGSVGEDAETRIFQTPPPPGSDLSDVAEVQGVSEEDLWSEALEEQASSAQPQAGQEESEEDLWASALEEQKSVSGQPGEDEDTKATEAISTLIEEETTEVGGIVSQADLDQLLSQSTGEDQTPADAQPKKSQGQTEIISQDELDNLWGAALSEQTGSETKKPDQEKGAESSGEVEGLWDAALEEQAGGGQAEEAKKPSEGGVISQEELDGLFAQTTGSDAAGSEDETAEAVDGDAAGDLTSQTEILSVEAEKTELISEGESAEKEGEAHGEEEEFEIDDELLSGKKSFKDKLVGIVLFKFLPEGKKRYIILSAALLSLGALGAGGYFAYHRFMGNRMAAQEAHKPAVEATAKKEKSPPEKKAEEKMPETPSQTEEQAKETPPAPQLAQAPSHVPMDEKNALELGLIIPIQFGPMETKVLQAAFVFEMRDHKAYEELKFYLPIYQDLLEKVANEFFSQDFYNEIHYAKEKLKDKMMEAFNERMKGEWVKAVDIRNFVIDIKKKEEAAKKKEEGDKEEKHKEEGDKEEKHKDEGAKKHG